MKSPVLAEEDSNQKIEGVDLYDPTKEEKEDLIDSYNNFRENFYQVRKMIQQAELMKALMGQLSNVQKKQKTDSEEAYEKSEEPIKEQEASKKDLENIKIDIRSFYQEVLSTRQLLNKAGKEAEKGKLNFNVLKEQFIESLGKIQDDLYVIYSDLVKLSPPRAEVEEISEQQVPINRLSKAKAIQAVYNDISKNLGPIIDILSKDEPIPEKTIIPVVDSALERMQKIIDYFPSIKAFSGQKGSFSELQNKYNEMIREMDFLNSNFQSLIKDESTSSITINNLYKGLQKFAGELEDTFGVKSKIPRGKTPKAAMVEPDEEEETKATPEDAEEEKPQGIKLPKVVNELPAIRAAIKPFLFRAFSQSLGLDSSQEGESGRRLRQQYNSFIRYYLMLKAVSEALQEVAPLGGTKAMEIAGVSDERIEKTLNFLKSDSKEDYENIVTLFNQQDPRELRKAFKFMDLYFKREKINLKPSTKDYRKILDTQFIPLEKINEQKIIEVLRPIIKSTLKEL